MRWKQRREKWLAQQVHDSGAGVGSEPAARYRALAELQARTIRDGVTIKWIGIATFVAAVAALVVSVLRK